MTEKLLPCPFCQQAPIETTAIEIILPMTISPKKTIRIAIDGLQLAAMYIAKGIEKGAYDGCGTSGQRALDLMYAVEDKLRSFAGELPKLLGEEDDYHEQ